MNSNNEDVIPQGRGGFGGRRHGRGRGGRGKRMLFFLPLLALFVLAKAGVVMLLWNVLVPGTFHGPELDYLKALELVVLVKILIGFGGGPGFRGMGGFGGGHRHWKKRWAGLSPEEREKYRDELRKRFS